MVPLAALLAGGGPPGHGQRPRRALPSHVHHPPAPRDPGGHGLRPRPRSAGLRRGRRRQRGPPRQRRGGGGGPTGPACPLAATGGARVPAPGQDLGRRHGNARQDDHLGAHGLAPSRLRAGSRVPRRRRDEEPRPGLPAGRRPPASSSRATSTTPPSSTAGRSSCTTSRSTSSSATSSSTTRTSSPTCPPFSTRSARSWRSFRKTAPSWSTSMIRESSTSRRSPARR